MFRMKHRGSAMKNTRQFCGGKARSAFLTAEPHTPGVLQLLRPWFTTPPLCSKTQTHMLDVKPTPKSYITHKIQAYAFKCSPE